MRHCQCSVARNSVAFNMSRLTTVYRVQEKTCIWHESHTHIQVAARSLSNGYHNILFRGLAPGGLAEADQGLKAVLEALQRAMCGGLRQQHHRGRQANDHSAQDAADARHHHLQVA